MQPNNQYNNPQQNLFQSKSQYGSPSQKKSLVPRTSSGRHHFTIGAGRYFHFKDESSFPYSKKNLPVGYENRDDMTIGNGFQISANYLLTPRLSIGYDIFTYYEKKITKEIGGNAVSESWATSHNLISFEYYFDPIFISNTFGIKVSYGEHRLEYLAIFFDQDNLHTSTPASKFKKKGNVYLLGIFYDYGADGFGMRFGINYINGDPLKSDNVYDGKTQTYISQKTSPLLFQTTFLIRYLF